MRVSDLCISLSMVAVFFLGQVLFEQYSQVQEGHLDSQHARIAVGACGTEGVKQATVCPGLAAQDCDTTTDDQGNRLGCAFDVAHDGCTAEDGPAKSGINENTLVTPVEQSCGKVTAYYCEVEPDTSGQRTQYDCVESTNEQPEDDAMDCPGKKNTSAKC